MMHCRGSTCRCCGYNSCRRCRHCIRDFWTTLQRILSERRHGKEREAICLELCHARDTFHNIRERVNCPSAKTSVRYLERRALGYEPDLYRRVVVITTAKSVNTSTRPTNSLSHAAFSGVDSVLGFSVARQWTVIVMSALNALGPTGRERLRLHLEKLYRALADCALASIKRRRRLWICLCIPELIEVACDFVANTYGARADISGIDNRVSARSTLVVWTKPDVPPDCAKRIIIRRSRVSVCSCACSVDTRMCARICSFNLTRGGWIPMTISIEREPIREPKIFALLKRLRLHARKLG